MTKCGALAATCLLLSCTGPLPRLESVGRVRQRQLSVRCRALFPAGEWRATHVVDAQMPFGNEATFIGVVATIGSKGNFRSLLLSAEGFVLFDASYGAGKLSVRRAVAPLDTPGFARGVVGDIRLLLFAPDGPMVQLGSSERGHGVCRWRRQDGQIVEAIIEGSSHARLRLYRGGTVVREAGLQGPIRRGFAQTLQLRTTGLVRYSLRLKLLDVESP